MLSQTSQHAIRALVHLAREGRERPLLLRDLAERAQVPPSYLSKILATLTRAGILEATRGLHGGYRMRRSPSRITVRRLAELFEGNLSHETCLLGLPHPCRDCADCPVHKDWEPLRAACLAFLDRTTLARLAEAVPESPRTVRRSGAAKRNTRE